MAVAPPAGAWIETFSDRKTGRYHMSLPLRERGLKQDYLILLKELSVSLPLRERGLKQV